MLEAPFSALSEAFLKCGHDPDSNHNPGKQFHMKVKGAKGQVLAASYHWPRGWSFSSYLTDKIRLSLVAILTAKVC
jgi:hypothetical protein